MKYLITESQLNTAMEKYLKTQFPEVISVSSTPITVYIAYEDITVTRTQVTVICDTNGIVSKAPKTGMNDYDLNRNIRKELHNFFGIDLSDIITRKLTLTSLTK